MITLNGLKKSIFKKPNLRVRGKLEFGDVLIFFYGLVFVRQYLWIVGNNTVAWIVSIALAGASLYWYVSTKQLLVRKHGLSFWLVVALPLTIIYSLRVAWPDQSFDVLNYHLLHTERTLRGPIFGFNDYFPSAAPFNPAADTLAGIARLFLGFRLGTVINLLALIWSAQIVDSILRMFIARPWLRSACVLLALLAENLLFEISTYMVDLLPVPLMLQATLLTLRFEEARNRRANIIHIGLLLGASTALKLTNLAVALPILLICSYHLVNLRPFRFRKDTITSLLLMVVAFLAPILPFTIYIFRLTGNPIFPAANAFFKSQYWPTHGGWDNRFGPHTFWETILWPIAILFVPERQSELAVYSGRMSLAFVVAFFALCFGFRYARMRYLCLISISSALVWSIAATGNGRYGLYQELLAGVTVVAVASVIIGKCSWPSISWRASLAALLTVLMIIQSYFATYYFLHKEWGGRSTAIADPDRYAHEAKLLLRDRSLEPFLTDEQRAVFKNVNLWLETGPKSTGVEVLLNSDAPIVAARQPEFFLTRHALRQFINTVKSFAGQNMYSLCHNVDLSQAKQAIAARGLEVTQVTPIDLRFFSDTQHISMMLIKVRIPEDPQARTEFESSWMKGALAAYDYREEIVAFDPPSIMHPEERRDIRLRIKNLGSATWPAVGTKDFRYQMNVGNRWVKAGVTSEDSRAVMTGDLAPNTSTELMLTVHAPQIEGDYMLEIDMVHEGVTWFKDRGAQPLLLPVRVQR